MWVICTLRSTDPDHWVFQGKTADKDGMFVSGTRYSSHFSWTPVVRHWLLLYWLVSPGFGDFSSLFFSHYCGFWQNTGSVPEGELPATIIANPLSSYLLGISIISLTNPAGKVLTSLKIVDKLLTGDFVSILWVNPSGAQSWQFLHQYFDYCCQYKSVFFSNLSFPFRIQITSTQVQSLEEVYWNIQKPKFSSVILLSL